MGGYLKTIGVFLLATAIAMSLASCGGGGGGSSGDSITSAGVKWNNDDIDDSTPGETYGESLGLSVVFANNVVTVHEPYDCKDEVGEIQRCLTGTVRSGGVVSPLGTGRDFEIMLKQRTNIDAGPLKGRIIFMVGGWSNGFYSALISSDPMEASITATHAKDTVNYMRSIGYDTFELRWVSRLGFGQHGLGKGLKNWMSGYPSVIKYLAEEYLGTGSLQQYPICHTGNSMGGIQVGYGLVYYDLERYLRTVVFSGSPNVTRLDYSCFQEPPSSGVFHNFWYDPVGPASVNMKWIFDYSSKYGYSPTNSNPDLELDGYCRRGVNDAPDQAAVIADMQENSLVPPPALKTGDYDYLGNNPWGETKLFYLNSSIDKTKSQYQGYYFHQQVQSFSQWDNDPTYEADGTTETPYAGTTDMSKTDLYRHLVDGANATLGYSINHGLYKTSRGAARIRQLLEAYCVP